MAPTNRFCLLRLDVLRRRRAQSQRRGFLRVQAEFVIVAWVILPAKVLRLLRACSHALSFLVGLAGGAKGHVGAGVAVPGTGGAGVQVVEQPVGDEGVEVKGGGEGVGDGAGGKSGVEEVVFGGHQVALCVLDAFEDEVSDAVGRSGSWDFAGFGARSRLVGAGYRGRFVGGAVDAELRVPEKRVDDIVPEVFKVVDCPGSVKNPAVRSLVAEL